MNTLTPMVEHRGDSTAADWEGTKEVLLELAEYCQPRVIGSNSTPTGTSSLGCGEERNFTQCKTAQL